MYVAWVDLERTGRLKPIPCSEIVAFKGLDENMVELKGVEQIREAARPQMEVTRVIMRKEDIRYIIAGVDPSDADDILSATHETHDEKESSEAAQEAAQDQPTEAVHKAHLEHKHTSPDQAGRWPTRFGNGTTTRPTGGNF